MKCDCEPQNHIHIFSELKDAVALTYIQVLWMGFPSGKGKILKVIKYQGET